MYNVFLLPKLELALHFAHGAGTKKWLLSCDGLLVGAVKHAVRSPLHLSLTAVALVTGFPLLSWLEVVVKVSEFFVRMNSSDPRWGAMGRALARCQGCAGPLPLPAPAAPVPRLMDWAGTRGQRTWLQFSWGGQAASERRRGVAIA